MDVCVQSTDKNFLVPVGGAVVASPSKEPIDRICKSYPGRASSSPVQVKAVKKGMRSGPLY